MKRKYLKCNNKGCENVKREFETLLTMLQDKFPKAFKYYEDRLYPVK